VAHYVLVIVSKQLIDELSYCNKFPQKYQTFFIPALESFIAGLHRQR